MAGPYFEILTMGGFRMAVARTDGFIVIVDSASGKKVHKAGCSWVTKKNFEEKVVENEREHGRYYWCGDLRTAKSRFSATVCKKCM